MNTILESYPHENIRGLVSLPVRLEQMWSNTDRTHGECWLWKGANRKTDGYGVFSVNSKQWLTHRLAWCATHSEGIPPGLQVCHTCDTPLCINPNHLFVGTTQVNTADRHNKDRDYHAKGEKSGRSKLTDDQARQIKELRKNGQRVTDLAIIFNVSKATVSEISNGRHWTHL